jgi:hypothetical protein
MMQQLPHATFDQVLPRVSAAWAPQTAPHHLLLAQTRAGKTTLIKRLLRLRPHSRALILDPKPARDAAWNDEPGDRHTWGLPVTSIEPGWGSRAEGGGPHGYWFRLVATPDRNATERALAQALEVVRAEGRTLLVIDDAKEVCRIYRQAETVESVMLLGGSNATSVVLATQELGYVPGRTQTAFTWVGMTGGWDAAKAAANILGRRGGDWTEAMSAIPRWSFVYHDNLPGNPGPVLVA